MNEKESKRAMQRQHSLKENKGNTFVGYTPLESIKTLSFATITSVIGSAVN